jgi:hypothetical protein
LGAACASLPLSPLPLPSRSTPNPSPRHRAYPPFTSVIPWQIPTYAPSMFTKNEVCCLPSVVFCLLSDRLLSPVCCLPSAAYCLLPAARCLLPAACCLLPGRLLSAVCLSTACFTVPAACLSFYSICFLTRQILPSLLSYCVGAALVQLSDMILNIRISDWKR